MKQYIKHGARILYNYSMTLIVFLMFIYPFMAITGDKFGSLLPFYCLAMFAFVAFLTYSDMKDLAIKEKKPQYELEPMPWKGLIMGLIGMLPVVLVVTVLSLIHLETEFAERIKHVAINGLLGPMYFVIRLSNESIIGYIAAILLLPAISGLGYLMGYHGIYIMKKVFRRKEQVQVKTFTKSPWNPTINENKAPKKKKKKTAGGQ